MGTPCSERSSTYFYQFLVYDPLTEHPFHLLACLPQIEDVFKIQGVNDDEDDVNGQALQGGRHCTDSDELAECVAATATQTRARLCEVSQRTRCGGNGC